MGKKRDIQATERAARRAALAVALGDIVLAEGLDALSLRPAAARLGTSDRMLLYYFGTKAALVADTLGSLSERLASRLASVSIEAKLSPHAMIAMSVDLLAQPDVKPFMTLWAEIVARSVRGDAIFRQITDQMAASWCRWIEERTEFPDRADTKASAVAILAVIEGLSTFTLLGAQTDDLVASLSTWSA